MRLVVEIISEPLSSRYAASISSESGTGAVDLACADNELHGGIMVSNRVLLKGLTRRSRCCSGRARRNLRACTTAPVSRGARERREMDEIERNGLNQATVRVRAADGWSNVVRLGAGATRAIYTFAERERDAVIVAAAAYAARYPLSDDGLIWDNHLAAVTGGANDVPTCAKRTRPSTARTTMSQMMANGTDVLR